MDINNINNFKDFKIGDNKLKNKLSEGSSIENIIPKNTTENFKDNLEIKDNITIIPESNFQNELNNNEIQNKDNKNLNTFDKSDLQTVPKNLTLFEIENEPNFVNKTPKNNVIKTFGPTNFPNNPEEMFINPKYL